MDVIETIHSRHSVKKFDPNVSITEDEVRELISLATMSPSAFNLQHWRFLNIQCDSIRTKIKSASFNQKQISDASALIISCADTKAWENFPYSYNEGMTETDKYAVENMVRTWYAKNYQAQHDEAIRSASMASMTLMLAAQAKGYYSCPIGGFKYDELAEIIKLPEHYIVAMIIAIGKPTDIPKIKKDRLSLESVYYNNQF